MFIHQFTPRVHTPSLQHVMNKTTSLELPLKKQIDIIEVNHKSGLPAMFVVIILLVCISPEMLVFPSLTISR